MIDGITLRTTQMSFFKVSEQYAATDETVYQGLLSQLRKIDLTVANGFVPLSIHVSRFNLGAVNSRSITQTHVIRIIATSSVVTQLALMGYDLSNPDGVGDTNTMIDHVIDSSVIHSVMRNQLVTFGNHKLSTYTEILSTAGHIINTSYPTVVTVGVGKKENHWVNRRMQTMSFEKPVMSWCGGKVIIDVLAAVRVTNVGEVV